MDISSVDYSLWASNGRPYLPQTLGSNYGWEIYLVL